ncbi:MAG: hypothetical protein HQM15_10355 [Deltaproteobacteria bacterium]|nr:hypothetical protein [Deltaproteobacteria bacterium]
MNDILSADLDSEIHSQAVDSETESQQHQDQILVSFNEFLNSEEFKKKIEENLQKAIQRVVPDIAERMIQEEIKRLTE